VVTRALLPEVLPLEVWDFPVNGLPLQAYRHERSFSEALSQVIRSLQPRHGFTSVFVCGGGASTRLARELGPRVWCAADPVFGASRAGASWMGGTCADLGKTSLKLARSDGTVLRIERPLDRLPILNGRSSQKARAEAVRFLKEGLRAVHQPGTPLLLGLPCIVDPDCRLFGGTYGWEDGDGEFVQTLARQLEAPSMQVINDAELAALAAAQHPDLTLPALVLTIGFGVGASVLRG